MFSIYKIRHDKVNCPVVSSDNVYFKLTFGINLNNSAIISFNIYPRNNFKTSVA